MTFHTLINFGLWHSYLTYLEVAMNTLVLISLAISEFLESLSFSVSINDYFILISIFVLFIFINKNNALNKNNNLEVWV
ncbi:hypothetical protein ATS74_00775 [Pseudoalteromonas sp. H103]|nr:hypothetical protein ATS74_00775 [Pseudoalteromonas sp. H103]|tara:strand:- start:132 stop:368 length:237 start_codon:yes stop_codon:yes gene_type:complete